MIGDYNFDELYTIDLQLFVKGGQMEEKVKISQKLRQICKTSGFFYVKNHNVPQQLIKQLISASKQFFNLPKHEKNKIHMKLGGVALRGYFSVGEELTSGKPDIKEGIYFGQQLDENHPLVANKTPLHGHNLFPESPSSLKQCVQKWIFQMEKLGKILMTLIAMSLKLEEDYFQKTLTKDPIGLFRIFNYPPDKSESWGVGQHTDYGLLTILLVTGPGLEVKNRSNEWVKADKIQNNFIVNIGDMLERLTKGLYRSTPHRVRNQAETNRLGIPFFYDPGWQSMVQQLKIPISQNEQVLVKQTQLQQRWDKGILTDVKYKYGKYLMSKVSKVFPQYAENNLKGM